MVYFIQNVALLEIQIVINDFWDFTKWLDSMTDNDTSKLFSGTYILFNF